MKQSLNYIMQSSLKAVYVLLLVLCFRLRCKVVLKSLLIWVCLNYIRIHRKINLALSNISISYSEQSWIVQIQIIIKVKISQKTIEYDKDPQEAVISNFKNTVFHAENLLQYRSMIFLTGSVSNCLE